MKSRFPCPNCHRLVLSNDVPPKCGVFQCPRTECSKYFSINRVNPEMQEMDISVS